MQIRSRAFSSGFDIATATETFTTDGSSWGEMLIFNSAGTQIARVVLPTLISSEYGIFISGGGGYGFKRHGIMKSHWTCEGEGRVLEFREVAERWFSARSRFAILEGLKKIAEISIMLFSDLYEVDLLEDGDLKLVCGMVIAIRLDARQSSVQPM